MNLNKSYDFFKPELAQGRIHIIGCGSVGSAVAELLARCGLKVFTLWDFDKVESKNICNQMFVEKHIGMPKVEALKDILLDINPEISHGLKLKPKGWQGERLSGYVFLAVDSIEVRQDFVKKHFDSPTIKAVFDFRTALTGGQHYSADWSDLSQKENLLASMDFTHEEAVTDTPTSACGETLGVATTVRIVSSLGVNNFIKWLKGEANWKFVQFDGFQGMLDAF